MCTSATRLPALQNLARNFPKDGVTVKAGQIFFLLFFQHRLQCWKNKSPQLKYMYLDKQFHCNPIQGPLLSGENLNFRCVSQSLSKKGRDTSTLGEQQAAFSFPHIVT